jgi:3-phosphoshikimate 1-carboxyvinyltransferase
LDTLSIKETDRIAALQTELAKTGVRLSKSQPPPGRQSRDFYAIEGHADLSGQPAFDTYEDHRMAMAFAPLALLSPITINDPEVVEKSYPDFWKDMEKLGFEIKSLSRFS